jgi:hypothetical protein
MFIVNGEILSRKQTPDLFKWYEKQVKEINESVDGDYVVFSAFKKPRFETDDSGRRKRVQRYKSVPPISTINIEEFGNLTWIYVPGTNSVKNENGMMVPLNPKPFYIGNDQSYHKVNDKDIIFFLMKISEATKNGKIFHVDRKRNSILEANASAIAAEAQYLLYHNSSPISPENTGNEDSIRDIAISFGVSNVDDLHIAEVRNELWKLILLKEKTRDKSTYGYMGFIEAANKIKDSSKRAVIFSSIEKNMLKFNESERKWYLSIDGAFDKFLCAVPANKFKYSKEVLIEYILNNPEFLDLLKSSMDKKKVKRVSAGNLERSELIDECARNGWDRNKLYKMKDEKLKQIIDNNIQPHEEEVEKSS